MFQDGPHNQFQLNNLKLFVKKKLTQWVASLVGNFELIAPKKDFWIHFYELLNPTRWYWVETSMAQKKKQNVWAL